MDYNQLHTALAAAKTQAQLNDVIVNAPFVNKVETAFLFLGIIVLLIANEETRMIDRIALSNTELADNITTVSAKPFHDIKIPLNDPNNIIAKVIATGQYADTTDWDDLFTPALSADEARLNQASGGIAYSAVYPIHGAKNKGALIFSHFQYMNEIGDKQHEFMKTYSQLVSEVLTRKRF